MKNKMEAVSEDLIEKRKEKFLSSIRNYKFLFPIVILVLLAIIVYMGVSVRSSNISGLKDISTGDYTLGPDLDPFLFLRWSEYIVANGTLMSIDYMRNVPLGFNTAIEMKLLPYMMAWFHKFLAIFNPDTTVTYSAIIFPVFFFALTIIAFFLFVEKIFSKHFKNRKISSILALIASLFFTYLPSLVPRTVAGIPEKESAGFFFLFLSFYLFMISWESKGFKKSVIFSILAGISTACMALTWGGMVYIFLTLSVAVMFEFVFNNIDRRKTLIYALWLISFVLIVIPISERYSLYNLLGYASTSIAFAVFFILLVDFALFHTKYNLGYKLKRNLKINNRFLSIIVTIIIVIIIALVFFGPSFLTNQLKDIVDHLIHPFGTDRFTLTVAENRQPYFTDEWKSSFGPIIFNQPLFFWLFFIGSIFLFFETFNKLFKKERIILTIGYAIFLFCLIFSRYSSTSIFNGTSTSSNILYFGGILVLIASFIYVYYKYNKENKIYLFKEIDFRLILLFVLFFLAIVSARGGVRLVMFLAPVAAIISVYFVVSLVLKSLESNKDMKIFIWIVAIIATIAFIYVFYVNYQNTIAIAQSEVPSIYSNQWQKAMAWVRENTLPSAVFSHWWDYGYWIQTIGQRATVLDGGNAIVYWDHLLGRHVLTGKSEQEALEFLYPHNATHLLIDSTDIGKYPAYASIGSDENYDRYSWIPFAFLNERATQELKNETVLVYQNSNPNYALTVLDDDIIISENGKTALFPAGKSYVGAVYVYFNEEKITRVEQLIVYQNNQARIPLSQAYYNNKLYAFESPYKGGVFIYPRLIQSGNGVQANPKGAMLYLSSRVYDSNLAKLYLFNQGENFKLVHTESSLIIENLRSQGMNIGEFAFINDFIGPIKIWEIDYPSDIKYNPDYLVKNYPNEALRMSK